MRNIKSVVYSSFVFLVLFSIMLRAAHARNPNVFLIKAGDEQGKVAPRALTGFRVKGIKGIITALHGVIGCDIIRATSTSGEVRSLKLELIDVDLERDLARVSCMDWEKGNANEGLVLADAPKLPYRTAVDVVGYPLQLFLDDLKMPFIVGETKPLRTMLSAEVLSLFEKRGSPSVDQTVVFLDGSLHPGHSGAPVLDKQGKVFAVANGGLKMNSGLSWAVPLKGIAAHWKPYKASSLNIVKVLQFQASQLYALDENPAEREANIEIPIAIAEKRFEEVFAYLKKQLNTKDGQIASLQGQVDQSSTNTNQTIQRVLEIAALLSSRGEISGTNSLALKAINEKRYNDAKNLLEQSSVLGASGSVVAVKTQKQLKELIDEAVQAHGGNAFLKFKSSVRTGEMNISVGGELVKMKFTSYIAPQKMRIETEHWYKDEDIKEGGKTIKSVILIKDGKVTSIDDDENEVTEPNPAGLLSFGDMLSFLGGCVLKPESVRPLPDGDQGFGCCFVDDSGTDFYLYFDKETHTLARITASPPHPGGTMTVTINLSNYKRVDGLLLPYQVQQVQHGTVYREVNGNTTSTSDPNLTSLVRFTKIQVNPKLDEAKLFADLKPK